jgi:isocitrate lyase
MDMRLKLRSLLKEKSYIYTFGIHNPMTAMIAERVGFDMVYMGGHDTTVTLLGMPDIGLITATEMINNAKNIARAVNVPVLADADTGYGNAMNVMRTVQDYEAAGVAGIHIEDQVSPKRCGQAAGKAIIPIEEAVGKLRAALDARKDKNFVIMARTDAISAAGGGFDEAVKRGKAYAAVGADMLFCEFPSTDSEIPRRFAEQIHRDFPDLPLYYNYCTRYKWYETPQTFKEIASMGYKVINISTAAMRVSMKSVWDYATDVLKNEEQAEIRFEKELIGHPTEDFHQFSGLSRIKDLESKYLSVDEVRQRYG